MNNSYVRDDGRLPLQMREIKIDENNEGRMDAGITFAFGDVEVIAGTTGPMEVSLRDEIVNESTLDINIRSLNGQNGVQEKAISNKLLETLKSIIILNMNPRSLIRFVTQTISSPQLPIYLANDQKNYSPPMTIPISEKCAIFNSTILVSAINNLPLRFLVLTVSIGVTSDNVYLIDPTSYEESNCISTHLIGFNITNENGEEHYNLSVLESFGEFNEQIVSLFKNFHIIKKC